MNPSSYTRQIEPVIEPAPGELGVFNPTACYDDTGRLQVLYRAAGPDRVTHLARSVFAGDSILAGRFVRQPPLSIQVSTGDAQQDDSILAALKNSAEDPRLVRLPGMDGWYATIVGLRLPAYSPGQKALTVLGSLSPDFERCTVTQLLTPGDFDDRHVIPMPVIVEGSYALLTRPQKPGPGAYVDLYTGEPSSVYLTFTTDLSQRPNSRPLLSPRQPWEASRIGGVGPQPALTSRGWLVIYMAIDLANRYSVGAALLDPNTLQVIARTPTPLLTPDDEFNRRYPVTNFGVQNVIFATTALVDEKLDAVTFLVGCNDIRVGQVVIPLSEILNAMDEPAEKS